MRSASDIQLQSIDKATLTPLVRQVLDIQGAEVIDWHREQVQERLDRTSLRSSPAVRVGARLTRPRCLNSIISSLKATYRGYATPAGEAIGGTCHLVRLPDR
jgi:hypothetical protein